MKSIKGIWLLSVLLLLSITMKAKNPTLKLDKGEKKFSNIKNYRLADFHFNRPVLYMDMVEFQTNPSDGKKFILPKKVKFYTYIKVGKAGSFAYGKQLWLANAILKSEYFWKQPMHPYSAYAFTSIRFREKGDKRFKAISDLKDIQDMFGSIDTEAELRIWVMATDPYAIGIHSYKKTTNGYRVRFKALGLGCDYQEYFHYYDTQGKLLKTKKLKSFRIKNCSSIVI